MEANAITYNALLAACERAGKADDAREVFDDMKRDGIKPDRVAHAALIGACVGEERYQAAIDAYKAMKIDPDAAVIANALKACAGGGFVADAVAVWQRAMKEGIEPTASMVTHALAAFEKGGAWKNAIDVVGGLRADAKATARAAKEAQAARTRADAAEKDAKDALDAPPPALTAAALVAGKSAREERAAKAEKEAEEAARDARVASLVARAGGVRADLPIASYATIAKACEKHGAGKRLVETWCAARASPHASADASTTPWFERALRACAASGLGKEAREILDAMIAECDGGATAAARASALGACAASPAGSAPKAAAAVWDVIKTAVGAKAKADGALDACPALQACRAAAVCAAKEADAALARDVLLSSSKASTKGVAGDAVIVAAVAAALALAGENYDDDANAGENSAIDADALATVARSGAHAAALKLLSEPDDRARGGIALCAEACAVVVAACETRGADVDAGTKLLEAWAEKGVAGAAEAAKKVKEGAASRGGGSAGAGAGGGSGEKATGAVAAGSPAAGSGSPAAASPAATGAGSASFAAMMGGGKSAASSANAKPPPPSSPPPRNQDGGGGGAGGGGGGKGGNNKGGSGKGGGGGAGGKSKTTMGGGWNKPHPPPPPPPPLPALDATAAKAAPFVPAAKNGSNVTAAVAKLSVAAPAFTPGKPSASAAAFVPSGK